MRKLLMVLMAASFMSCQYAYQPKAEATVKAYMFKNKDKHPGYKPIRFYPLASYQITSANDTLLPKGETRAGWLMSHDYKERDIFGNLNVSNRTFILNATCDSVLSYY